MEKFQQFQEIYVKMTCATDKSVVIFPARWLIPPTTNLVWQPDIPSSSTLNLLEQRSEPNLYLLAGDEQTFSKEMTKQLINLGCSDK